MPAPSFPTTRASWGLRPEVAAPAMSYDSVQAQQSLRGPHFQPFTKPARAGAGMTATLTTGCLHCLTHHGYLSFLAIKAALRACSCTNTSTRYWCTLQLHNVCHTGTHSGRSQQCTDIQCKMHSTTSKLICNINKYQIPALTQRTALTPFRSSKDMLQKAPFQARSRQLLGSCSGNSTSSCTGGDAFSNSSGPQRPHP
jgi:hypothetical protein